MYVDVQEGYVLLAADEKMDEAGGPEVDQTPPEMAATPSHCQFTTPKGTLEEGSGSAATGRTS